jgi:hypothetical protein
MAVDPEVPGDRTDRQATEPTEPVTPATEPAEPVITQTAPHVTHHPATFAELLAAAQAGPIQGRIRDRLAHGPVEHLYVLPPGEDEIDLPLDGLPPLLEALERDGIDVTVIAGPPLLDDPNATIIAWATRSVLWAIESGKVARSDAQEAASRLELAGVSPFGVALVRRN